MDTLASSPPRTRRRLSSGIDARKCKSALRFLSMVALLCASLGFFTSSDALYCLNFSPTEWNKDATFICKSRNPLKRVNSSREDILVV